MHLRLSGQEEIFQFFHFFLETSIFVIKWCQQSTNIACMPFIAIFTLLLYTFCNLNLTLFWLSAAAVVVFSYHIFVQLLSRFVAIVAYLIGNDQVMIVALVIKIIHINTISLNITASFSSVTIRELYILANFCINLV